MSDITQPVKSPCIEVCSLNNEDVCIGCYRTANEIIEWFSAPNERKREILVAIDQRRAKPSRWGDSASGLSSLDAASVSSRQIRILLICVLAISSISNW